MRLSLMASIQIDLWRSRSGIGASTAGSAGVLMALIFPDSALTQKY